MALGVARFKPCGSFSGGGKFRVDCKADRLELRFLSGGESSGEARLKRNR